MDDMPTKSRCRQAGQKVFELTWNGHGAAGLLSCTMPSKTAGREGCLCRTESPLRAVQWCNSRLRYLVVAGMGAA